MREVAHFYDVGEAEVAAGFLRSHGYDVTMPEYHTLSAQPALGFAVGGFRLLVQDPEYFEAKALLDSVRKKAQKPVCSNCGAAEVRREKRLGVPGVVNLWGLLFSGLFFPFARGGTTLKCRKCGATYDEVPGDEPQPEL